MKPRSFATISKEINARLRKRGVELTIGGEPSYVPEKPDGLEWSVTAVGPTKLKYAYALADALVASALPRAVPFFSPGKSYPGETNPRWALHLVWPRDGSSLVRVPRSVSAGTAAQLKKFRGDLLTKLKLLRGWMPARDPNDEKKQVWVLPLDFANGKWITAKWPFSAPVPLLAAEGPAGLRLPLNSLGPDALRRALTIEIHQERVHVFLPPLLQKPFTALVKWITTTLDASGIGMPIFEGYLPPDEEDLWAKLSLTPDPGVLEVNLPPCDSAAEYGEWLKRLESAAARCGLRSFKQPAPDVQTGTGGGNHLLFGGPTLDRNAFFKHPAWITSILRYWQHHPSLSYLFTGHYVGSSSQAPRPDESARELYDLEMAYHFLAGLPAGKDHRGLISETLRHLHTDGSGNTHRSEISFDKFWNPAWDGGCRGLIEFRAIETMPRAEWMSAVALLWHALAARLFEKPFSAALIDHGTQLHDRYFLPSLLWEDLEAVLSDLQNAGYELPRESYRAIWEWRFPQMLELDLKPGTFSVRKALEGWPLLCETPLEGGSTSRFVDTSMERLEFTADQAFACTHRIFVQGRELRLEQFPTKQLGAGLRFRRTALHPSLHPGISPHMPLFVVLQNNHDGKVFRLDHDRARFELSNSSAPRALKTPCKKLRPELLTYDLRLG